MKIIDLHCDTISTLYDSGLKEENTLLQNNIHVDINKMKQGDYMLQNFACFVCLKKVEDAKQRALDLIKYYHKQMQLNHKHIRPVLSYKDILDNRKHNVISSVLTLEEGDVVGDDIQFLKTYYDLGVRMIALTWNYPNRIGFPNMEAKENMEFDDCKRIIKHSHDNSQKGLTAFGIEYIKEMERLGMIIDVSHLSDAGFYDVLKHTTKPFVASHSNARHICNVRRNLSDDMIIELAKRKGVMGINFCGDFLRESEIGNEPSLISDIVKHIQYIKQLAGVDVIALGSDFDGIDSQLEIKDASFMQDLCKSLYDNGFTQEEVEKIAYKNVLRVYEDVLISSIIQ